MVLVVDSLFESDSKRAYSVHLKFQIRSSCHWIRMTEYFASHLTKCVAMIKSIYRWLLNLISQMYRSILIVVEGMEIP